MAGGQMQTWPGQHNSGCGPAGSPLGSVTTISPHRVLPNSDRSGGIDAVARVRVARAIVAARVRELAIGGEAIGARGAVHADPHQALIQGDSAGVPLGAGSGWQAPATQCPSTLANLRQRPLRRLLEPAYPPSFVATGCSLHPCMCRASRTARIGAEGGMHAASSLIGVPAHTLPWQLRARQSVLGQPPPGPVRLQPRRCRSRRQPWVQDTMFVSGPVRMLFRFARPSGWCPCCTSGSRWRGCGYRARTRRRR